MVERSWGAVVLALSFGVCGIPSPLHAQCGWDPHEIEGDSLPYSVSQLAARTDNPIPQHVIEGIREWVSRCDPTSARSALQWLRNQSQSQRENAALNALAGVMAARGPDIQVEGARGYLWRGALLGSNAEREAVRRLSATAQDHNWPEPAAELAALGLATRSEATLRAATEALLRSVHSYPALSLALAEVELARERLVSAASAAEAARTINASAADRIRGIAAMRGPGASREGAEIYLSALNSQDAYTLQRYYEDLLPLLTREEIEQWEQTPQHERGEWLHRAWEWRASIATISTAERLTEHFDRVAYATRHYRRHAMRPPSFASVWLLDYLPPGPLDDRGIVHIRHGPPDEMTSSMGILPRVGWLYHSLAGGPAVLDFAKSRYSPDYFLADPTGCESLSNQDQGTWWAEFDRRMKARYQERLRAWRELPEGCIYTVAGDSGRVLKLLSGSELRSIVAGAVLATESATPRLTEPLVGLINSYAFRRGLRWEIITFVAIDAELLSGNENADGMRYEVALSVAAEDPATRSVVRSDTAISIIRPTRFAAGDILWLTLPLSDPPPGTSAVRAGVRNLIDKEQGQVLLLQKEMPSLLHGRLSASDLVVAQPDGGHWRRGNVWLTPYPGHRVSAAQPFSVFQELYGLAQDDVLQVEVTVAPLGVGGVKGLLERLVSRREALRVQFDEMARLDPDGAVRFTTQVAADLRPGTYTLRVAVVRRSTGEEISTHTFLHVH